MESGERRAESGERRVENGDRTVATAATATAVPATNGIRTPSSNSSTNRRPTKSANAARPTPKATPLAATSATHVEQTSAPTANAAAAEDVNGGEIDGWLMVKRIND